MLMKVYFVMHSAHSYSWFFPIPYSNSESSHHAEKSVQLQMQDLRQAYEAMYHPMMYTFNQNNKLSRLPVIINKALKYGLICIKFYKFSWTFLIYSIYYLKLYRQF